MKTVFFGSGNYSVPVIEMLTHHGLQLVLTTEISGPVIDFLRQNDIPYVPTHLKEPETIQKIKELNPTLGVLASYGAILSQEVIDIFPEGIWNIHPSLLPKYKGPSPIQATLLNGDKQTGITIIKLDNQVDHGPILAQKTVELTGNETLQDLLSSMFKQGGKMIDGLLNKLENGQAITATPQNHSEETFTARISKQDGHIDITNPPAPEKLNNMIRAYYPWPGVWFRCHPELVSGSLQNKIIKLFPDNKIQVEGKNPMTYKEFVNGYQDEGKKLLEQLKLTI